jgi:hypothetical protein
LCDTFFFIEQDVRNAGGVELSMIV